MYVVLVEFAVKPQHIQDFRPAILANARASLEHEEGCHRFDVCFDPQDASKVLLYELYTDRAAFDLHLKSAHFLEFDTLTKDWVNQKKVSFWQLEGSV